MSAIYARCVVHGPEAEVFRFRNLAITKVNGRKALDSNRVIPMPPILDGLIRSYVQKGLYLLAISEQRPVPDHLPTEKVDLELQRQRQGISDRPDHDVALTYLEEASLFRERARQGERAWVETGYIDQSEWREAHWASARYASNLHYISKKDPLDFTFEAHWRFPVKVFERLGELFPSLRFECAYYRECGTLAGEGVFNPRESDKPFQPCEPTEEIRQFVGAPHPHDEDDDDYCEG